MFQINAMTVGHYNVILGKLVVAWHVKTLREAEAYVKWEARKRNIAPVYTNNENCMVKLG